MRLFALIVASRPLSTLIDHKIHIIVYYVTIVWSSLLDSFHAMETP
jgi:hypothetical protein